MLGAKRVVSVGVLAAVVTAVGVAAPGGPKEAHAAVSSCVYTSPTLDPEGDATFDDNVSPSTACTVIDDNQNRESTVNTNSVFGNNDWVQDEKIDFGDPGPISGTWNFDPSGNTGFELMIVIKDGGGPNTDPIQGDTTSVLVAYDIDEGAALQGDGTLSGGFVSPFLNTSSCNADNECARKQLSNIAFYTRGGSFDGGGGGDIDVPLPGTLGLLGVGLVGLGWLSRRKAV